jgi:hypothetical protein
MKKVFLTAVALLILSAISATAQDISKEPKGTYLGLGYGLDYGGIGVKGEIEPVKYVGMFAGVGYNYREVGWNVGAAFRILPDARVCPVINALYGYNSVLIVKGTEGYDATSYGVTFGSGMEWLFGRKRHKLSLNLFWPWRSCSFKDKYNAVKKSPYINMKKDLSPVTLSIGLNFLIF